MYNGDLLFIGYLISLILLLGIYFTTASYSVYIYKTEEKGEKTGWESYAVLIYGVILALLGIGRLFCALFDVLSDFTAPELMPDYLYFWKIGISLQTAGFGLFFILIEKLVMKGRDKYLLFIGFITFFLIGMILNNNIYLIVSNIFALWIPIMYIYIAAKSEGDVRKKALYVFFGILLIFGGSLFITAPIMQLLGIEFLLVHTIAYFVKSFGVILLFLGFK